MHPECRVLVVTPDYPPAHGGIQRMAHGLVSHLQQVLPRVVTVGERGSARLESSPVTVVRVPAGDGSRRMATVARLGMSALVEAIRFSPDVILNLHLISAPWVSAVSRVRRVPVVLYLHANELTPRPWLTRLAIRESEVVVSVSHFTEALAERMTHIRHSVVIPNGVDLPSEPGVPVSQRPGPPTILTVCRIAERYKGLDVVLRALPLIRTRVSDARWVVIGNGRAMGALQSGVAASGLDDAVTLLGSQPDPVRDDWMRRAHVFAMPSRLDGDGAGEGFGIVFLEAAAHRLPVVAGDVGGALDSVIDGRTGRLVDPLDHVAVADAISSLLLDAAAASRLGEAGRRHAQTLTWPVVARQVEEILIGVSSPSRRR